MAGKRVKEIPEANRKNAGGVTSGEKDFFGLLADWEIDSQSYKDELRD